VRHEKNSRFENTTSNMLRGGVQGSSIFLPN